MQSTRTCGKASQVCVVLWGFLVGYVVLKSMRLPWIFVATGLLALSGCSRPQAKGELTTLSAPEAAVSSEPRQGSMEAGSTPPEPVHSVAPLMSREAEPLDSSGSLVPITRKVSGSLLEVKSDSESRDPLAILAHVSVEAKDPVSLRTISAFLILKDKTRLPLERARFQELGGTPPTISGKIELDLPFKGRTEKDVTQVSTLMLLMTFEDGSVGSYELRFSSQ